MTRLKAPLNRVLHWLSRNTRKGSRRNIGAHYDLGNDLFELFLDPTMMYSCAYYQSPHASLEEASVAKLDRICQKLELKSDDHLLEIGTGWGGFAIHAAKHYGCRVTTTTISRQQFELARERACQQGVEDRITFLFEDYRDLEGQYDKLVSIEMIEAIGHQYLDTYFEKCSSLLKPDGMMLLQAITIADQRYKSALNEVDYIKKFIFPGGFLPSVSAMSRSIARVSDMKMFHMDDIGPHYARTLADWRQRFFDRLEDVRKKGYSDAFIRMWEYYLCYCEGGFLERDIGTVQMLLTKPGVRREPVSL
jgi:cyclopropane-fatty-acyl-phospholipid synthase